MINYCSTFSIGYLLSLKLQYLHGFSPFDAGSVLFIQPVIQAVFSPVAGRISDKIHPRKVASSGMAVTCLGLITLVIESYLKDQGIWPIYLSLVLLGFGFALFGAPNTNSIMGTVEKTQFGVASSMIATMRTIGQVFSMGIVMSVFALVIGKVKITQEVYAEFSKSLLIIFIILTVVSTMGIFASLAKNRNA
jgi:MFS family permease